MEELMNTAFGSTGLQMESCGKYHSIICLKQFTDLFFALTYSDQAIIIAFDALICVAFIISHASKNLPFSVRSLLTLSSLVWNGGLGLVYFGFGLLMIEEKLRLGLDLHPLNEWVVLLTQGVTWVLISLLPSSSIITGTKLKLWSLFVFLFSGFLTVSSLFDFKQKNELSFTNLLDLCSFVGSILLILCSLEQSRKVKHHNDSISLIDDSNHVNCLVTPFARAGFFSRMTFHWLHPLMKKGYMKPLEEKDIPCLSEEDCALNCYSLFEKERQKKSRTIFWSIVSCHQKEIWITGLFALLKVLMLSSGPVLLKEFVNVSMGKEAFKYEGYALACGLFMSKLLESVSQRQWYFRTKRLGLQLRSLLSAAIFKKQLKLSNLARLDHSSGEIMNYVTVDAYRIGEFPFWFHKTWSTILQLCIALVILYNAVGLATVSAMIVIVLTVACNAPLAKLQHKYQSKLMISQDSRLKALSEALIYMKILKLYAWETHFKKAVEDLRGEECKWLSAYQLRRSYNSFLFWSSPVLVSCLTFLTCYFLDIPLDAVNVFTFVATLRLVQDPVREIPDVIGVVIQAKVGFARLLKFLDAPELDSMQVRSMKSEELKQPIILKSCSFSWDVNSLKPTLRNINLNLKAGDKVAICGEVGSGKSTLLAAILGEVPKIVGEIHVGGNIAYVSQNAWIQSGTVQDNILFGSPMNRNHYQETLEKCSLVKDVEMLPFGDLTQIGERGVNLSGGQKQRLQLARALYQDADIYLLDDPFSAVDAHTSSSLFNEYVMKALAKKTVLLVTHQVDFLPDFNTILLMSEGEILHSGTYNDLIESSNKFRKLVDAHKDTVGSSNAEHLVVSKKQKNLPISQNITDITSVEACKVDQLIKKEERETGDTGLKPYLLYLNQDKGLLYASISVLCHVVFVAGQILQNSWMAANVENNEVSMLKLISVYLTIGLSTTIFLLFRSLFVVTLGMESSKSIFSQLINSLFRAPMSFFDSTPLGRILSRVSSDLNIVDLDVPFILIFSFSASINVLSNIGVLTFITKEVLLVSIPLVFLTVRLQKYYLASAKELMRIDGTTRSVLANHLSESLSGSITIRAFKEEDRFFAKTLELIDKNASPYFHNFAGNEWLIQRLEMVGAAILSSSALFMVLLPSGTFSAGFVGMAISYGLSLNMSLVFAIQNQCTLANNIISVERLNQYMHVPSEAPEIIDSARPDPHWPSVGTVEIDNLQIRYRPDSPLVLRGISCKFEGGHKIGIVGRTGSGKTTLISALFRLVEPCGGRIVIDGLDIATIGLHDLRQRIGIIPQDPTLFYGSVRYNLDPLGQYTDLQIWEVLEKCHLGDIVRNKEHGLNSIVVEDGSNWSMGQRQLFCLGRALLKRSRILVLDEATASIDNTTDAILQKTIRSEFAECTVVTVAHRIPTVMDCTMVMAMSDGVMVEYDEPKRLMQSEKSLFGELVKEYWSHSATSGA